MWLPSYGQNYSCDVLRKATLEFKNLSEEKEASLFQLKKTYRAESVQRV